MMLGDYGRLYYSASLDGLHWQMLNGGKRVFDEYRGHADICQGHDRRFYLVGNRSDDQPDINLWISDDLKDLKTFSQPPRKLFQWDMATIDTIIRKEGDAYYAIIKDERYPTLEWATGKTIRICLSTSLLGPYSEPGPPISPGFREAPTLIPSPNG
jgi:hypothetical protein